MAKKKIKRYKFTFKLQREMWHPDWHDIKLNKKKVGYITEGRIRFAVKKERSKKDPAPFKWVTLKFQGSNDEAKDYVKKYSDAIQDSYNLHSFEDD